MSGPSPRKMKKLEEEVGEEEGGDELDENIRQALTDIDDAQRELDSLNEKASKEILQVETKYNKLRKPFYDKRATIIERIPNFWVNAVINHPQISMLIDEEEEDCLHFLNKLEVEEFENVENGFRIKFIFDENPFFENTELVKEFQLGPNTEPKSTSTVIQWKENMDLSKKQKEIIMQRRKRGLDVKTFFSWFSDNTDPAADDIAEVIKDDLWPNPLQYYLTPDGDENDDDDGEEGEDGDEDAVVMEEEEIEEEEAGSGDEGAGEEGEEGGENGEGDDEEAEEEDDDQ
ncbi:protein SET [Folsomia candida]|uniref:Protein SET n=1 Tax=Folsomia candida TaxID=158441 RepID=A0A226ES48_FOLCA|nr:protein SET [Folsomia candida]OXA59611.1 Protein SET [Folsomia candida]